MKITRKQLRKIIRESVSPRPNPRFEARRGEPRPGQVWSRKKIPTNPGSFTYHGKVEVLGYRGGPRGKEIIVKSLTHPNERQAVIDMPLVSFLGSYQREA